MHGMLQAVGVVLVAGGSCLAQSSERQKLIQQVEAADALAQIVEREAQDAPAGAAAARPGDRLPFDQVLKVATEGVSADLAGSEPADLAALNNYQLRQAIAQLHLHNQALYMQLNAKPVKDGANDVFRAVASVQGELARSRATTQPTRSAIMMIFLTPPTTIQQSTMDNLVAAGQRQEKAEAPWSMKMTPDQLLTAVLSGQPITRAFGVASTLAPTDARIPSSKAINQIFPGMLPLGNDVPATVALRADPPGNPSAVIPKPEEISRLVNALGVPPDIAEQLATGRMTLAEAMAAKSGANQPNLANGPTVNDPRWQPFYSGSSHGVRNWLAVGEDTAAFTFQPGGGIYVRSDQRLNNDADARINSEPDRRVNINADRRTTIQLDPRTTNQP